MTDILVCLILLPLNANGMVNYDASDIVNTWFGTEWDEYENQEQALWEFEIWQVDINRADAGDIMALPGIDEAIAKRIVSYRKRDGRFYDSNDLMKRIGINKDVLSTIKDFISFSREPFVTRYHIRTNRRFGSITDDDTERYNGSPYSLTQRLSLSSGSWKAGLLLDKDRYEPDAADFSRYYLAYRSQKVNVIVGDFNVNSGYGLVLRTRPSYYHSIDSKAAFIMKPCGIQPAAETQENSAFCGLGVGFDLKGLNINMFGAQTALDALVDDQGNVLRLSDAGLHRTEGEARKNNTITELTAGVVMEYRLKGMGYNWTYFLSGYASQYNPSLTPEVTARDKFPLTGNRNGAYGFGSSYSGKNYQLGGEIGTDYDGDCAWKVFYTRNIITERRWNFSSALYHYPTEYNNPHSGSPASGKTPKNRTGAAMLFGGRCNLGPIELFKTHIEIEQRPWRTYTIPVPSTSARGSIELDCPLSQRNDLVIRYRRKFGTEGQGAEAAPTYYNENRLRLTWLGNLDRHLPIDRYRFWIEGASRQIESEKDSQGISGGIRFTGNTRKTNRILKHLRYSMSSSFFSATEGLSFYVGEGDLPDRFASIRLLGSGIRCAGTIAYRTDRTNWLGFQIARTIRTDDNDRSGDMEVYLTLSYQLMNRK
ncbi:MAG: helix-hairpin-helix domain-containing protein [Candidatus Hatepunaea meridiana]|nr:helix-hairpin-helix domain-containing protein [Candidatus Hatepunaea meridiana]